MHYRYWRRISRGNSFLVESGKTRCQQQYTEGGCATAGERSNPYMFFDEIAEQVSPLLDEIFPESSGVKLIAEPGRYLVAASCTLLTNVIGLRSNIVDKAHDSVNPISDKVVAAALDAMTREDENHIVEDQVISTDDTLAKDVVEEMTEYAQLFARQNLAQQEVETYTHSRDLSESDPSKLLCPPEEWLPDGVKAARYHTAEGMSTGIVADCLADIAEEQDASIRHWRLSEKLPWLELYFSRLPIRFPCKTTLPTMSMTVSTEHSITSCLIMPLFVHDLFATSLSREKIVNEQRSVSVSDSFDGFQKLA